MKTRYKVLITFTILIFVIVILYQGTKLASRSTGLVIGEDVKIRLAQCMAGKNISFYYSRFCADCYTQKSDFGIGFQFINVVDCDNSPEKCDDIGIGEMPAWRIHNVMVYGYKTLGELKDLSGC